MYTFQSRIRYSETDSEGKLKLLSLLDYFQDCSTFQSEDLGIGVMYLKERHMAWVLSSWQIEIERSPRLCEKVEIGTFPYEFRSFMGYRNFFMRSESGEWLARANSIWVLLDMSTGRPASPPQEMFHRYTVEPRLEMEYASRKIAVSQGGVQMEPIPVKKHHLDTNYHVNNGQYIAMAQDLVPEDAFVGGIHRLRAEYKKQAFLNDELYPYTVRTPESFLVSLRDEKGAPYTNVEFY